MFAEPLLSSVYGGNAETQKTDNQCATRSIAEIGSQSAQVQGLANFRLFGGLCASPEHVVNCCVCHPGKEEHRVQTRTRGLPLMSTLPSADFLCCSQVVLERELVFCFENKDHQINYL